MQTFLPMPSFAHSAACLDRARLGKQRVECVQLLRAIGAIAVPPGAGAAPTGWVNHPAARMWRGYAPALGVYTTFVIHEWRARGYQNLLSAPYGEDWEPNEAFPWAVRPPPARRVELPAWLGDLDFHASHQGNLLRKDPIWYEQFGWNASPDLPYVWP